MLRDWGSQHCVFEGVGCGGGEVLGISGCCSGICHDEENERWNE